MPGSVLVTGILVTLLLLVITYINVYLVFVVRRRQLEHEGERVKWVRAMEEERDRLLEEVARDVHDDIGQLTHVLRMCFHRMFKVEDPVYRETLKKDAADLIDKIAENARNIGRHFNSLEVREVGLEKALERDLEIIETAGAIRCSVTVMGNGHSSRLDHHKKLIIYRIAQEALQNAIRHGAPGSIDLWIIYNAGNFILKLEDNGRGFILTDVQEQGSGLTNMKKRANALNGSLAIESGADAGTKIRLTVPY